ncbi:hypothetical protein ACYPKM_01760 [Pseudomonas aeruginosa]
MLIKIFDTYNSYLKAAFHNRKGLGFAVKVMIATALSALAFGLIAQVSYACGVFILGLFGYPQPGGFWFFTGALLPTLIGIPLVSFYWEVAVSLIMLGFAGIVLLYGSLTGD